MERWLRSWAPGVQAVVNVEPAGDLMRMAGLHTPDIVCWRAAAGPDGQQLIVIVPGQCIPRLLGLQAGVIETIAHQHPEEGSLAAMVVAEAVRTLVVAVANCSAASVDLQRNTAPIAALLREAETTRFTGVLVTLGDPRAPLVLLSSPQLVSGTLPAPSAALREERVERRRRAIADEVVSVEALLGHAEVSVSDVAALAVGDVIILQEDLGANGSIAVRGGGVIAGAMPGQLDGKRAVQVKKRGDS
ncbi:MAG TPA: FliM/FliN family flagellar motor C-terminal domain-containing protein [Steroidobacteraceae bacterium]